jgi:hypothetical protein
MISPTQLDIGRNVIYTGNRYPGGKPEHGVIAVYSASKHAARRAEANMGSAGGRGTGDTTPAENEAESTLSERLSNPLASALPTLNAGIPAFKISMEAFPS